MELGADVGHLVGVEVGLGVAYFIPLGLGDYFGEFRGAFGACVEIGAPPAVAAAVSANVVRCLLAKRTFGQTCVRIFIIIDQLVGIVDVA